MKRIVLCSVRRMNTKHLEERKTDSANACSDTTNYIIHPCGLIDRHFTLHGHKSTDQWLPRRHLSKAPGLLWTLQIAPSQATASWAPSILLDGRDGCRDTDGVLYFFYMIWHSLVLYFMRIILGKILNSNVSNFQSNTLQLHLILDFDWTYYQVITFLVRISCNKDVLQFVLLHQAAYFLDRRLQAGYVLSVTPDEILTPQVDPKVRTPFGRA